MATKKRNNNASKNRKNTSSRNKKPTMQEMEKMDQFRIEITLWIVIAVSLILFISNLGFGGKIGGLLSGVIRGLFGIMGYIFPFLLLVGSFFVISNRDNKFALLHFSGFIALFVFLTLFFALVSESNGLLAPQEVYLYSKEHALSGGWLGGILAYLLVPAFGQIGAYIIDAILVIISLVIATGRSAMKGMQKQGRKVYESAKESNERRQEYVKYRRDEQEKRRMDMKVSGVSGDTKLEKSKKKKTDNINELIPEEPVLPEIIDAETIPLASDEPDTAIKELKPIEEKKNPIPSVTPVISGNFSRENKNNMAEDMDSLLQNNMPKIISAVPLKDELNVDASLEQEEITEVPSYEEPAVNRRNPKASQEEIEKGINEVAKEIQTQELAPKKEYVFPPIDCLKKNAQNKAGNTQSQLLETADKLQKTLDTFGVHVQVTNISCGPAVTRYEIQPEMGVKVSKIVGLADDIKLNLAAADIRIEAPIPGKAAVGIEVPNAENVMVSFRELIESKEFTDSKSTISFAVGKDIGGKVKVTDIAKMPHLLIAGATGSGKSVCINTIIMSILYKARPDEVKLIMIDPKVVELSVYNGIPHLMIPVVTDPKKAAGALNWAVAEMTDRYQKFAECNVRDINGYNAKIDSITVPEGQERPAKMPKIVIIVDELADLMMVASGDVEEAICRLAQLARAAGIHLIIATQRPSVNVITGLIKANMPSRIAFAVTSGVDSRTILDMVGAEKLLGKGDMLFYPQGIPKPLRVQGAFVSDGEVSSVVEFLKDNNGNASYSDEMQKKIDSMETSGNQTVSISSGETSDGRDSYFMEAAKIIIDKDKASIGMLQRFLKVGFNRAARIMDQMEEAGIVGPEEGTKPRKVLMTMEEFQQFVDETL